MAAVTGCRKSPRPQAKPPQALTIEKTSSPISGELVFFCERSATLGELSGPPLHEFNARCE